MSVKKLLTNIYKADCDYHLIEDGDKIAVGLSGGKDSTLLLYCLQLYRQFAAHSLHKHFSVCGIHINLNFGEESMQPLRDFFSKDTELHFIDSKIANILDLYLKNDRVQCSRCSQLKKGAVVKAAKEFSCSKLCFGHHADDAIETLLLNMFYGGKIATFAPKMFLSRESITFIRPFLYCTEKEIIQACLNLGVPRIKSGCPVDGITKRAAIKELLQEIENKFPGSKRNILRSLHNLNQVKLWEEEVNEVDDIK